MSEPSVTLKELDGMVEMLFDGKKEIKDAEEVITDKNKKLAALKTKIIAILKEHDRDSYQTEFGTVSISEKWRVKLPENDIEKQKLLDHLKERGIFTKYVTVNSNALNSLFLQDWEAAKQKGEGMEFRMPGVGEPTLFEDLGMRKK